MLLVVTIVPGCGDVMRHDSYNEDRGRVATPQSRCTPLFGRKLANKCYVAILAIFNTSWYVVASLMSCQNALLTYMTDKPSPISRS